MSEVFDSSTHLAQQQKDHCSLEAATQSKKLDDTAKLRLLGYDAVLGRPLGFWSSTAMSLCYMCPIDEIVVCTMTYAYAAPLVFVSLSAVEETDTASSSDIPSSTSCTSHSSGPLPSSPQRTPSQAVWPHGRGGRRVLVCDTSASGAGS